jgi:hypothetical protein
MSLLENFQQRKCIVRVFYSITVIFCLTHLCSCVSGSYIIAGDPRPATSPTNVKIYFDPPEKYETLGTVEASLGNGKYKRQKTQDKVINKLKALTAKIGANGILLTTSGDKTTGTSGGYYRGYYGTYFGSRINEKRVAEGRAIYVIEAPRDVQEEYRKKQGEVDNFQINYSDIKELLKSDGYFIVDNPTVDLKEGELASYTKKFTGGVKYRIICFSEDNNVLGIGVHLEQMNGTIDVKDAGHEKIALVDYTPNVSREMKVVVAVKKHSSRTLYDKSRCIIVIAYKK